MILITPKLFSKKFRGLAIYPFIFLKDKQLKYNKILINHEKIHFRQQKELLWIFFFLWYGLEFVYNLIRSGDATTAYYLISFEKEAYLNEQNLDYLKDRPIWAFLNYL